MATRIQIRRGNSTEWTSANPVLSEGELGLELDTKQFKIGTGTTSWNNLPYAFGSYATSSGIATYAINAGVSTSVIGGIGSISHLSVSGISTFSGITTHTTSLFGTEASFIGIVTASSFSGNASSATYATTAGVATALQTARTIALTGDVVGEVSFDGTSNVSIAATIQPNSVDLGTDTTGNYVATVADAGSSDIVVSGSGSETAAVTLGLSTTGVAAGSYGSSTQIPTFTVDSRGRLTAAGTASVGTALTVAGDSGSENINLLNETLTISGGTNLTSSVASNAVTINLDDNISLTSVVTSGIVTAPNFSGNLSGTATTATNAIQLQTARTINLTGDVAGSVSFDGTTNVSIAATIQPNSVTLGGDTTGDYVQSISGTSNQITVTSGTGESSTPILSIPNQFTIPQDATVTRDLQVNRDLNVNGNITIGGSSATLFTTELKIFDPDIVLGFRTDASNNDISNDNTANHGGIAIASTEGTPLISLYDVGIGETNPATYKKFMWFKSGTFSGLGTDAWLSNYAIGIGSTQFPIGTRLASGNIQFTQSDLSVVRNINASGVTTSSGGFVGNLTGNVTGNINSSGVSTFSTIRLDVGDVTSTSTTTTATSAASIASISTSTYRSATFQIQSVQGTNYNMTTINVIHDGSETYMTEYGTINQPIGIATYSTDISGGFLRLLAYPSSVNSTTFKVISTALNV